MKEIITNSAFFGVFISLAAYFLGVYLRNRFKKRFLNPLLIAILLVIGFLLAFDIEYETYNASAKYLSWLLTPSTVCLAIPLYQQLHRLKGNVWAVLLGITAGVFASLSCVLLLSLLFGLDHSAYATLLPKSVTTAIGMPLAEQLGGDPSIAAVVIIITGVLGNIFAEGFLKLIRVTHPIAKGIAIGNSAHALGTARALEMGEIEGAMSGLAIVVTGLITVIGASVFAQFM